MESTTHSSSRIRSSSQSVAPLILWGETEDKNSIFWQEWQVHQEHLYHCCLKWVNSNRIDAEEILSQAMLKAWNQWQNSGSKIKYPKTWLTKIVQNFCIDLYRKRKQNALLIENIDDIKLEDYSVFYLRIGFPEVNIFDLELWAHIEHKIKSLPPRLQEPFVLYYCHNKSYKDIAKQFSCSEDNVRKSVRKARSILQKYLTKYLAGEDDTSLDSPLPSLELVIPLAEKSQPESNGKSPISTKSQDQEISYQITVLCQESLPHHWYSSTNLLVWR